jgi:hypothetical protein
MRFRQLLPLIGALFSLYIIWGSTYFVIRIGVESWPPLMMAGIRFLSAGVLLLAFLLLRGHKLPPLRPMLNAALIGLLLLAVGNGFVTLPNTRTCRPGSPPWSLPPYRCLPSALAVFSVSAPASWNGWGLVSGLRALFCSTAAAT